MEEENILETYYSRIANSDSPSKVLFELYQTLFGKVPQKSEYALINKLLKLYGRKIVLLALVNASLIVDEESGNITGLLIYLCNKSVDKTTPDIDYIDAESIRKNLEKTKKKHFKIGDPFND